MSKRTTPPPKHVLDQLRTEAHVRVQLRRALARMGVPRSETQAMDVDQLRRTMASVGGTKVAKMSVYRFRNKVAFNPPKGETFYLSPEAAQDLIDALGMVTEDIHVNEFSASTVGVLEVED